jgi:hypothetical protein
MNPGRTGGSYCRYRWHGDSRYMKHTMEHGHANDSDWWVDAPTGAAVPVSLT